MCLTRCLPLSGSLPATKTYASRRWTWIRHTDPAALADGHLTITCRRSDRPCARSEDDTYGLQETKGEFRGPGARVFLLENLTDPTSPDTYETIIGDGFGSCTCKGYVYSRHCKHIDATRAMVEAGGMGRDEPGEPETPAGADEFPPPPSDYEGRLLWAEQYAERFVGRLLRSRPARSEECPF